MSSGGNDPEARSLVDRLNVFQAVRRPPTYLVQMQVVTCLKLKD